MYKVVLIDDESIIVEGVSRVVDWAYYHCQAVATGHDATSGADAIRRHRLADARQGQQRGGTRKAAARCLCG